MQTWAKLEKLRPSQIQFTMRPRVRPTTPCTFLPVSMFSHTMAVPSGRALNGAGASWRVSALARAPKGTATAAARPADTSRRSGAGKDGTATATPRSARKADAEGKRESDRDDL